MTDKKDEPQVEVVDVYYEPDPNAPWYNKINPCHYDHVYALDWLQRFAETFAPTCQCCAGVRIFILLVGCVLGGFIPHLRMACVAIVLAAIAYDNVKRWIEQEGEHDTGNT